MAKFTIPCFVLILVLLSTPNVWKIATVEGSKCCTDHPELGKCVPGEMTTQMGENAGNFALQIVRKEASASYLATVIIAIAYVDFLSTLFHNYNIIN
ncbi:unnamed protein product [Prunus armeniaca]|uniref:Uncharacterized protein n=1 Tax=Prunus armeniaca TaxID=36596 RepID=A0A6J5XTG2_PRUAR|nr:unnamed protein product [Prunus armeniaca]